MAKFFKDADKMKTALGEKLKGKFQKQSDEYSLAGSEEGKAYEE